MAQQYSSRRHENPHSSDGGKRRDGPGLSEIGKRREQHSPPVMGKGRGGVAVAKLEPTMAKRRSGGMGRSS